MHQGSEAHAGEICAARVQRGGKVPLLRWMCGSQTTPVRGTVVRILDIILRTVRSPGGFYLRERDGERCAMIRFFFLGSKYT